MLKSAPVPQIGSSLDAKIPTARVEEFDPLPPDVVTGGDVKKS